MNKGDLISMVSDKANLSKTQATEAINAVLNSIESTLKEGNKVSLVGFGTFACTERKARTGRNPRTGEAIEIPSKNIVKFKPGKELAGSVN